MNIEQRAKDLCFLDGLCTEEFCKEAVDCKDWKDETAKATYIEELLQAKEKETEQRVAREIFDSHEPLNDGATMLKKCNQYLEKEK